MLTLDEIVLGLKEIVGAAKSFTTSISPTAGNITGRWKKGSTRRAEFRMMLGFF
jgi:hypothetical protein